LRRYKETRVISATPLDIAPLTAAVYLAQFYIIVDVGGISAHLAASLAYMVRRRRFRSGIKYKPTTTH